MTRSGTKKRVEQEDPRQEARASPQFKPPATHLSHAARRKKGLYEGEGLVPQSSVQERPRGWL
ncbi:uncharacterized protein [Drosophila pseudoobscura]|uniref:Uncharacterized protein isoform X2 n=1 Tax=Drosophila pseudoobscura pseudoobscura TaxID=46245 RepID=A0A6I8VG52_DROPS|nr:uncharacterized protein LOC6898936 isoform X2 [Drosophila pseudoobscura]